MLKKTLVLNKLKSKKIDMKTIITKKKKSSSNLKKNNIKEQKNPISSLE